MILRRLLSIFFSNRTHTFVKLQNCSINHKLYQKGRGRLLDIDMIEQSTTETTSNKFNVLISKSMRKIVFNEHFSFQNCHLLNLEHSTMGEIGGSRRHCYFIQSSAPYMLIWAIVGNIKSIIGIYGPLSIVARIVFYSLKPFIDQIKQKTCNFWTIWATENAKYKKR